MTSNSYAVMVDSGVLINFIRPCVKVSDRVTLCFACLNTEVVQGKCHLVENKNHTFMLIDYHYDKGNTM